MKISDWVKIIDKELEEYVKVLDNPQKSIYESMKYSLCAGGKRLRPSLLLITYTMFDSDYRKALPFACAMEMIHTYSLIHDDLPCMDNDDYRRGKLSNHKMYGEANALLAGDALLNKSFEICIEACQDFDNMEYALRAVSIIASSAGTEGMIGGQVVDISSEGKISDIEMLKYMYSLKTGAIIESSIVAGAILGGANEEEIKKLEKFAQNLGIAFQIQDDVLDVIGDEKKLGKSIGSDVENNKITYLSFMDINKAKEHVKIYTKKAIENLDIFGEKSRYLKEISNVLVNREL